MVYANILDQILSDLQPEVEVGLKKMASQDWEPSEEPRTSRASQMPQEDWRGRSASAISGDGVLAETAMYLAGKDGANIGKKVASKEDVVKMASDLFHLGMSPSRVAAELEKKAEILVMQKGLIPDIVKDMAGTVGYAFIEPNHYNSCQESLKNINTNGKLAALSVKRIAACSSCSHCTGSYCSLYKRPIVSSKDELAELIKAHVAKLGKKATRQVLAQLHEGTETHVAPTPANFDRGTIGGFTNIAKTTEKTLTAEHIASAVEASSIVQVYENFLPIYGKTASTKAVKSFLDGLKKTAARVDIGKVDCGYLKGKLASGNAIVGVSKCASCTHRHGMHCGLTGGTLMSFPGMDSIKSNKRASADAKDGFQVCSEFQLEANHSNGDIDTTGFSFDDVQTHGPMNL
jgi:hypothetical protein